MENPTYSITIGNINIYCQDYSYCRELAPKYKILRNVLFIFDARPGV